MDKNYLVFDPNKEPYYCGLAPGVTASIGTYIRDELTNKWYILARKTISPWDWVHESDVPKHILGMSLLY